VDEHQIGTPYAGARERHRLDIRDAVPRWDDVEHPDDNSGQGRRSATDPGHGKHGEGDQ